jgi:hypothetical protein
VWGLLLITIMITLSNIVEKDVAIIWSSTSLSDMSTWILFSKSADDASLTIIARTKQSMYKLTTSLLTNNHFNQTHGGGVPNVTQTCSFLYNNFHLFRGSQRTKLINNLLSERFFFLFLHWSSEVRTYFQHLLIYKVLRADRRYLPCFTDTVVMERFGGADSQRARSSMPDDLRKAQERRTRERRLTVFDTTSKTTNNEELLIDVAMCSKIDSYVHLCLTSKPENTDGQPEPANGSIPRDSKKSPPSLIPEHSRVYIDASMRQYSALLTKYYRGVRLNSLDSLPSLTHRMVMSDSNPYN